ncbi:MAG: DUF192 domain-containing protein [Treponema sp.]|nr:DUF192 domain-containing protein [Treponema sp.]
MSSKTVPKTIFFRNHKYHGLKRIITDDFTALLILSVLLVVFFPGACAAKSAVSLDGKPQTGLTTKIISITGEEDSIAVEVELAQTEEQRNVGLMHRTSLEDGKGMLFIFETDQVLSFWMKNTLIPLSIAYISYDGTIVDIRDMYPNNTSPVHSSRSVRYALEVPQGWFGRAGIKAGDKVTL